MGYQEHLKNPEVNVHRAQDREERHLAFYRAANTEGRTKLTSPSKNSTKQRSNEQIGALVSQQDTATLMNSGSHEHDNEKNSSMENLQAANSAGQSNQVLNNS